MSDKIITSIFCCVYIYSLRHEPDICEKCVALPFKFVIIFRYRVYSEKGTALMFDFFPEIFGVMFVSVFVLIFATIVVTLVRGVSTWNKNNKSPRLTVDAAVVSKRENVHHSHHNTGTDGTMSYTTTSTTYYVTFQFESGDRLELQVQGYDYGMIAEGDRGRLTFQGTRFLSFERGM